MPVKRPLQPTPCSHCWLWRKEDGSGGSECTNGCALSVSFLATRHSPHLHPWLENSTFFWKCGCHSGAPNKGISPQKDHYDHHCVRQWVLVSGFWSLFCSQCPRHLQQDPIFKKSALIAEEQLLPLKKGIRVGSSSFFKKKSYLVYFSLCWIFIAAGRLSLVVVSRGYSLIAVCGFLIMVISLVAHRL